MLDLFELKSKLSTKQLSIVNSEFQKKSKNKVFAYILLIVFGGIGIHRYYIGKIKSGLFFTFIVPPSILVLFCVIGTTNGVGGVVSVGLLIFIFLFLLYIEELIFLSNRVDKKNNSIELKIIKKVLEMNQNSEKDIRNN